MPSQPALLNGQLIQRRQYATNTNKDDTNTESLQRVYYGSLAPRMKAVKFFSLTTSFAGLAAQPILMEQGMKLGGTGMAVFLCGFAGFFTFVTPFLLHFVTKKYVTEIHYNPQTDEYIATTISIILQKIKTKFRPSDVKVPEVPGMFTSFVVDGKPLFVDPALFDDPEHYVRIMGYDKPIDFKLETTNISNESDSNKLKK
ncbi:transmembrane protein 70 homolog, mitochondrial [Musca vetustissima]|uniref:transmembrane protein 70 homolog, mitochondrial n=1 Tax=Musca vetustissima TaxID=27455 RepID=UPI002AB5E8D8|nr:transmembrane protein 70 homolog, mitochondrial [Musca vetustissima]